jgi:hypothetical protein
VWLRGASAFQQVVEGMGGPRLRIWAVWEPVLSTDLSAPSTATLGRLRDKRAAQFWDPGRLLSRAMGERDDDSIVWDHIAIYAPGQGWQDALPAPYFAGGTVVRVISGAKQALERLLPPTAAGSPL